MTRDEYDTLAPAEKQAVIASLPPEEMRQLLQTRYPARTIEYKGDGTLPANSADNDRLVKVCSLCIPCVGFIAGPIFLTQPGREALGRTCIKLALIGHVLLFFCFIGLLALAGHQADILGQF
jgi:hypothetical protein